MRGLYPGISVKHERWRNSPSGLPNFWRKFLGTLAGKWQCAGHWCGWVQMIGDCRYRCKTAFFRNCVVDPNELAASSKLRFNVINKRWWAIIKYYIGVERLHSAMTGRRSSRNNPRQQLAELPLRQRTKRHPRLKSISLSTLHLLQMIMANSGIPGGRDLSRLWQWQGAGQPPVRSWVSPGFQSQVTRILLDTVEMLN